MEKEAVFTAAELHKLHRIELYILKEIDRVCKKNKINYFLAYGTLLGAVRHKGFIPWDDDIDIAMERSEYNRFIEVFQNDTDSERFFLENWNTEDCFGLSFSKVKLNGTVFEEHPIKKTKTHKGIFVDVFPYDFLPGSEEEINKLRSKVVALGMLYKFKKHYLPTMPEDRFSHFVAYILYVCAKPVPSKYIKSALEKNEQLYNRFNGGSKVTFISGANRCRDGFPVECLDHAIECDFEDCKFPIPQDYDTVLKNIYGDYMKLPPVEKRYCRHNPGKLDFGIYEKMGED